MASDTDFPLAKRRSAIAACAAALRRATDPVTKPALPVSSSASAQPTFAGPACSVPALALDYEAGGPSTGNDFATIRVRNTGAVACELDGPIALEGLDLNDEPDTQRLRYTVVTGLVLSARTSRVPVGESLPAGEVVAAIVIGAQYRDDGSSPDGLCEANRVIPSTWQLTFPDATVRAVLNHGDDPEHSAYASLITCKGQLNKAQPIDASP